MQNAMSIIRNCFIEITRIAGDKMRKQGKFEVMEDEIEDHCQEGDSCNMGQVAPSSEVTQKKEVVTSGNRPTEVPGGHGGTNPESPKSNGQSQMPQADLEEQITMKVNTQIEGMMQNLSNIIKNMIKEEIKNCNSKGYRSFFPKNRGNRVRTPYPSGRGMRRK